MKFWRIHISTWTSSFRYPNLISGLQPTLKVPPISTILGLVNACAGRYVRYSELTLGYYFDYSSCNTDLETIYQFQADDKRVAANKAKSNVIRREFLYDCNLYIYVTDNSIVEYFRHPHYSLLLGRSNDLASIDGIEEIEIEEIDNATKIKGQIIPYEGNCLPGILQALPKYFTNEIPRRNIGTEAFSVISYDTFDYPSKIKAYRDIIDGEEIDIYMHHLNFD